MRKVLINQLGKIGKFAKKVAEESPNTSSAFLYYEPKAPKLIKGNKAKK